MSSVLPGFEYDIFISYRQKDNKGDGWVTEFVEALKTELEATFKEDISVYFDINPHDGLLETHDVAASLKEKLKALIFVPIVSRTYCDPNSYAWEHEFKAFVEQASQDQFGLKVKLPGGNVASRVLPVRIHDLEPEDIKLAESYLGFIRPVDFIYHSQGVNRPLRQRDDDLAKTGQQLVYRDQINKVANAIKQIINGLKMGTAAAEKEKIPSGEPSNDVSLVKKGEERKERKEREKKPAFGFRRKPLIWSTAICILLIIAAFLAYPKIFKRDTIENLRSSGKISVAVMPFQNLTNDTTKNIWQGWIQNNLINYLSIYPNELKVRPIGFINNLIQSKGFNNDGSITSSVARSISRKLDANVVVVGSIRKAGNLIRINAQLINSKTEEVYQQFQVEGRPIEQEFVNIIDSLSTLVSHFLVVSELKKEGPANLQGMLSTVNSPIAYQFFIEGKKAFEIRDYQTVFDMLSKAIEIDSSFIYVPILLAQAYGNCGMYESAKKLVLRQYEKREQMPLEMKAYTRYIYAGFFDTPLERIKFLNQLLGFNDQSPDYHYLLGNSYNQLFKFDDAIPAFEKALDINEKWGTKPWWVFNYADLGYALHQTGHYKKERKLYRKAEKDFPDDPALIYNEAVLALTEGKTQEAIDLIEKYISICNEKSTSEAAITVGVGSIYCESGLLDKTEEYYRKALNLEPGSPGLLNTLAYFLIDKDRNIHEGLDLINKALETSPEDYEFMDIKGWGLYKQGKYLEALEILQRSWDKRMDQAIYSHAAWLHLEEAKKAAKK